MIDYRFVLYKLEQNLVFLKDFELQTVQIVLKSFQLIYFNIQETIKYAFKTVKIFLALFYCNNQTFYVVFNNSLFFKISKLLNINIKLTNYRLESKDLLSDNFPEQSWE